MEDFIPPIICWFLFLFLLKKKKEKEKILCKVFYISTKGKVVEGIDYTFVNGSGKSAIKYFSELVKHFFLSSNLFIYLYLFSLFFAHRWYKGSLSFTSISTLKIWNPLKIHLRRFLEARPIRELSRYIEDDPIAAGARWLRCGLLTS